MRTKGFAIRRSSNQILSQQCCLNTNHVSGLIMWRDPVSAIPQLKAFSVRCFTTKWMVYVPGQHLSTIGHSIGWCGSGSDPPLENIPNIQICKSSLLGRFPLRRVLQSPSWGIGQEPGFQKSRSPSGEWDWENPTPCANFNLSP